MKNILGNVWLGVKDGTVPINYQYRADSGTLIINAAGVATAKELLGHSSSKTTEIYKLVSPKRLIR